MRKLECYELDDGELIVEVTAIEDTTEVTNQLAGSWTWDSFQLQTLPAEEGEGGPTEWMTLIGARRRAVAA